MVSLRTPAAVTRLLHRHRVYPRRAGSSLSTWTEYSELAISPYLHTAAPRDTSASVWDGGTCAAPKAPRPRRSSARAYASRRRGVELGGSPIKFALPGGRTLGALSVPVSSCIYLRLIIPNSIERGISCSLSRITSHARTTPEILPWSRLLVSPAPLVF
ncbi:hypothetical protein MSAN_00155400 [Mycena sanguinolenta]|uniref:Uncharacterized protein n=1 Tax=Mycena sanguinolenta TaxID=230812 RepID=A0A8H6ZHA9_9AGAR|nr:hypothetical protein MSAN_00155400 [Mycena sanguinolenta]